MHKLLHRPTSSLPIPILSSSYSPLLISNSNSNSTPLLLSLPLKPFHSLTMAAATSSSTSSGVSFPLQKSLSSPRYSNASYVRTCFCPTLTLTRHTTTTSTSTSNNTKNLPWLLLKHSQHSNATSQSSFHNNPEQQQSTPTTEDDSSSSSTNTTSSFRLNNRRHQKAESSSSSTPPDLLAIPGVGPRNFRKLVQKGIQGVAQLKQLYKDKVVSLSKNTCFTMFSFWVFPPFIPTDCVGSI